MDKDVYTTVEKPFEIEIEKIKGSRFISRVIPVATREEAEEELEVIRKKYYDANHNCFGYKVGLEDSIVTRYSDDGEPSQTAGKPIFSVIEGSGLTNLLVVSTRYFGGTKLGTGGLIKAYTESAKAAVYGCKQRVVEFSEEISFRYGYDYTNLVMSMLSSYEIKIVDEVFDNDVSVKGVINRAFVDTFISEMFDKSSGRIEVSRCS